MSGDFPRVSLSDNAALYPPVDVEGADGLSPEWQSAFQEFVTRAVALQNALIDGACRAAQLTGTHGVLVDGNTVRITRDVPFGEIHYAPVDLRPQW